MALTKTAKITLLIAILLAGAWTVGYWCGYVSGAKESDREWSEAVNGYADRLVDSLRSKGYVTVRVEDLRRCGIALAEEDSK